MSNEITVKLKCNINDICDILENKKFQFVEKYLLDDSYYIPNTLNIKNMSPRDILSHAIILRTITGYNPQYIEKQILKEKIDKLIDLNLNGTITLETLQGKKAKLQNKINSIEKEQEHLKLELEDSMSLNQGLNKFKTLFKDNEIMPEFDKDVFELMIEKVIIGEKDNNGETNPRVITFILKSGNKIKCEDSTTEKNSVVQNQKNQQSSYR